MSIRGMLPAFGLFCVSIDLVRVDCIGKFFLRNPFVLPQLPENLENSLEKVCQNVISFFDMFSLESVAILKKTPLTPLYV